MIRLDDRNQRAQPLDFRGEDASPEREQAVVDAPLVGVGGERALRLVDEALRLEPADVAIQVPGLERDAAARVIDDVLTDAVAVAITATEHRQDQQLDRLEGEQGNGVAGHDMVKLIIAL